MLGPWHLRLFDGAIDRRPHWYYGRHRHLYQLPRGVTVWHSRTMTGPHVVWPPMRQEDQPEYARRVVATRRESGALITVLHRRGATAMLILDVFGPELTEDEQRSVRFLLEGLKPAPAYGKIPSWASVAVGPHGAYSTNAVVREYDWSYGDEHDRLTPALARLEQILSAVDVKRAA
jgi:hypothetical protein